MKGTVLKIRQSKESNIDYSKTFLFAGVALGIAISAVVVAAVPFFRFLGFNL